MRVLRTGCRRGVGGGNVAFLLEAWIARRCVRSLWGSEKGEGLAWLAEDSRLDLGMTFQKLDSTAERNGMGCHEHLLI